MTSSNNAKHDICDSEPVILNDKMVDCPGIAHEKDNNFNPSSQGPYGPGHHWCDICDNEFEISEHELTVALLKGFK